ncbi:MAG: phosphatidylglycerophosphatase A, partial [Halothiobacillaceae bacterium]|nr:phosphatidylglycerophosphatase A [Halothiobacillaceae bacterium]
MTISSNPALPARAIVRDPVLLLAHGLGSGLAPKAPGTFGTLAALLPWLLLVQLSLPLYWGVVLLAGVGGIWLCGEAARRMGGEADPDLDPGGIVWDEWVGVWIALGAVPMSHA